MKVLGFYFLNDDNPLTVLSSYPKSYRLFTFHFDDFFCLDAFRQMIDCASLTLLILSAITYTLFKSMETFLQSGGVSARVKNS